MSSRPRTTSLFAASEHDRNSIQRGEDIISSGPGAGRASSRNNDITGTPEPPRTNATPTHIIYMEISRHVHVIKYKSTEEGNKAGKVAANQAGMSRFRFRGLRIRCKPTPKLTGHMMMFLSQVSTKTC
jgi:hypothetical protein